jgi:hypothetical protein
MIRETSFRKKPSSKRTNPPRKSRGIQDLLLPLATSEMQSAINHRNKASLRITIAGLYNREISDCEFFRRLKLSFFRAAVIYAAPVMVLIFAILLPNIFFAVTSS